MLIGIHHQAAFIQFWIEGLRRAVPVIFGEDFENLFYLWLPDLLIDARLFALVEVVFVVQERPEVALPLVVKPG